MSAKVAGLSGAARRKFSLLTAKLRRGRYRAIGIKNGGAGLMSNDHLAMASDGRADQEEEEEEEELVPFGSQAAMPSIR